jgi:hypothetical protein
LRKLVQWTWPGEIQGTPRCLLCSNGSIAIPRNGRLELRLDNAYNLIVWRATCSVRWIRIAAEGVAVTVAGAINLFLVFRARRLKTT